MCSLLYIKQVNNKGLGHSMGKYIQYLIMTYSGGESGGECVCMCVCVTGSYTHTLETGSTLKINYTSIKKLKPYFLCEGWFSK